MNSTDSAIRVDCDQPEMIAVGPFLAADDDDEYVSIPQLPQSPRYGIAQM